ncbi:uncharacterized protein LOC141607861 [Silene latifolia]|uniref:uncharacterized protein LOC141607861 n=1 Tax=Silene latifolia TaxID=37657 RepID=UPI003D77008C
MSINCSDIEQFPPLVSSVSKHASSSKNSMPEIPVGAVVGGPSADDVQKTKNVNEIVGVQPYDLDSIQEEPEWQVQKKRKGKSPLTVIEEEPLNLPRFTAEDVKDELEYWQNSVFCFILGANPPVEVVDGFIKRIWGHLPIDKVSFLPNGVFLVRFNTKAAKDRVLQQGHYLFDNKPLIVRPWSPDVELNKDDVKEVPVWVRLEHLPLKFWGKCLPRIAGLLGKFVQMDVATKDKTRLGFARVMLEVPFGKPLPGSVKFMDKDGLVVTIKVVWEWKPTLCKHCKGVGHESEKCRKAKPSQPQQNKNAKEVQKQWRPKVSQGRPIAPVVVPVSNVSPTETGLVTPLEKPNQFQVSWERNGKYHVVNTPAKKIIRFSRHELIDKGQSSGKFGKDTFLESLNTATPVTGIGVHQIGLFGLLETKVKPLSLNNVRNKLCASWSLSTNSSYHKGGRIWVLWNPSMFSVNFLDYSSQAIHMEVKDLGTGYSFFCTMIYAFNDVTERKALWEDLGAYNRSLKGPWVICGDFNTVLVPSERLGGNSTFEEMDDFQRCVADCGVTDCSAIGSYYTWSNKQEPSSRVFSRLDRMLVNSSWLQDNASAYAHFYPEGTFEHTPCVVQTIGDSDKSRRSFKYYNMWSKAADFKNCVSQVWHKDWGGSPMFNLVKKLKSLKWPLKQLNKDNFDDVVNNTARARLNLEFIQLKLGVILSNARLLEQELEASGGVRYLEQACHEQVQNKVIKIEDSYGHVCEEPPKIQDAFLDFYVKLLGTSEDVLKLSEQVVRMGKVCSSDHRVLLMSLVSDDEIKKAMFSIPGIKLLWADGLCEVLLDIISDNQGGFIKGRSIVENILICQDIVRLYNRKSVSPRFLMKVDLKKAYDSVNWDFLEGMLAALDFPEPFVTLVMECVRTASYSLVLNGNSFGFFKGQKGLRQGDPLSPLLFTISMEYLSRVLSYVTENMGFKYHPLCSKLKLSHLMFADDLLLFSKGDTASIMVLLRAFATFSRAYGLQMSPSKTNAYFNGVLCRLNSICRNFLWDGTIDHIRVPPVSWEKICSPKHKGGPGIRDSFVWNTAAIGKLVWWVYFNPDKLWVKWVSQIYLKGQAWPDYQPSGDLSWGWKSVCRVRDKMSQGNVQGQWVLDTKGYTLQSGYELLRVKFQPVVWHKVIWNWWCVPKHRFICWMMVRNAMQVKSKLFQLGISPDDLCLLCGGTTETHVHLFEQCVYSRSVLQGMAMLCQINIPSVNILQWVWNQKWDKARKGIVLCAFMAYYYQIWMMRNRARVELHLPRPAVALHQAKCSAKLRISVLSSQLDLCTRSWLESIDLCK